MKLDSLEVRGKNTWFTGTKRNMAILVCAGDVYRFERNPMYPFTESFYCAKISSKEDLDNHRLKNTDPADNKILEEWNNTIEEYSKSKNRLLSDLLASEAYSNLLSKVVDIAQRQVTKIHFDSSLLSDKFVTITEIHKWEDGFQPHESTISLICCYEGQFFSLVGKHQSLVESFHQYFELGEQCII